ncbi:uncharacterized protein LOC113492535 [Trichoplusia ni]|uniref:Uncharacterized protein LOC113492535 n=1 Tax=Trichoplusia ni TaxID=7111 RepID=A0A7E5VC06_TRINI|nr:uncharacterized protein LOC113492535 [Trichoplusia ni]
MFPYFCDCRILLFANLMSTALSMSLLNKNPYAMDSDADGEVAEFIIAKGYLPNEKDLPKTSILKNVDSDVTYLLSKLSDEELIKLLADQPNKKEYNLKDIVKIASDSKYAQDYKPVNTLQTKSPLTSISEILETHRKEKRFRTITEKPKPEGAFFRLENKEVDPFPPNRGGDPQYLAVQKLNNILYSRPSEVESDSKSDDEDEKKELLFDVLVAQLKTLCCKRNKPIKKKDKSTFKLKALLSGIMPQEIIHKPYVPEHKYAQTTMPNEQMFLIINEEIKSNGSDDGLISVDPDSLGNNSSVMLLGPIATPMSEAQLKIVMMRISNELSKPEYMPLLQQISDGTLSDENIRLVNSLVSGPQTRRYIKPHRCNHQSKLARVYGGPKWIVCTGYLNINQPSLYD